MARYIWQRHKCERLDDNPDYVLAGGTSRTRPSPPPVTADISALRVSEKMKEYAEKRKLERKGARK